MELPPFVLYNYIFTLTNDMTRKGAMYDTPEEYGSDIFKWIIKFVLQSLLKSLLNQNCSW